MKAETLAVALATAKLVMGNMLFGPFYQNVSSDVLLPGKNPKQNQDELDSRNKDLESKQSMIREYAACQMNCATLAYACYIVVEKEWVTKCCIPPKARVCYFALRSARLPVLIPYDLNLNIGTEKMSRQPAIVCIIGVMMETMSKSFEMEFSMFDSSNQEPVKRNAGRTAQQIFSLIQESAHDGMKAPSAAGRWKK